MESIFTFEGDIFRFHGSKISVEGMQVDVIYAKYTENSDTSEPNHLFQRIRLNISIVMSN